ncbi:metallophosphoesterase [filamentous cyanobacterium LEGE 11480]|uniref:Metallophosphoesterase n=1 Tax=Romeriopsis navalis LEGE 11480 TaxID=2777977 RepID=A0A928VQJ3_9CYAN|nr:metallophosphoesterase [Romeriopsis navalis]MBE9031958.1 metallophosphoesterase [Romeriopsis navalis LEGE 11480]
MQRFRRIRKAWKAITLCFLTLFSLFYIGIIEPNWIDAHPVSVTLPHLSPEFEGYKIVQLTDIHADEWMTADRLRRIIRIANRQNPDLVVLTGDYITMGVARFTPALHVLNQLTPKDGTIAILGNHDGYINPQILIGPMERAGVKVFQNQVRQIRRGNGILTIAGLGDAIAGHAKIAQVLPQLPSTGAAILLVHEPDFADETAATHRFDLQLSGHSHGGQISLPFLNIRRITPRLAKKYPTGLYHIEDLLQYTSRGLGLASNVRVRLNCRPEIAVFTLHAPPQSTLKS